MRFGGWLDRLRATQRAPRALAASALVSAGAAGSPADALALVERAQALQARGALNDAEAALEQALALRHDLVAAHLALGRLRLDAQRLEDAADSLQLACAFGPHCARAHAALALALARQRSVEAARAAAARALELAGDDSAVWADCGRAYKALGDYEAAARCYDTASALDPGNPDLASQRGYAHFLRGDYDAARSAYAAALAADPAHVPALHNRGLLELETGEPQRAAASFERACALRPSAQSLAALGHALRDLGRIDEACAVYRRALATDPDCGDARINLSYALLMRGDLAAGWAEYERRFEATATAVRDFGLPWWRGEPLRARRLLVSAEQGLGDEIMFASCLPQVIEQAAGCVLECSTRLAPLFARSFPQAQVHGSDKTSDRGWLSALPACDYQVAIGSLPRHFRAHPQAFGAGAAYLVADRERVAHWRRRVAREGQLNVGIAWRGGALRTRQWLRSIPLADWTVVLRTPGVRFFALQHGEHARELDDAGRIAATALTDLSAACRDLDELAAIVCALDLIVSVDCTLVHLAGALGKAAWVLLPHAPEWRYPRAGSRMPWYGSVRLFRQRRPREWGPVLDDVAAALEGGEAPHPSAGSGA
jgi:tetratricopeptide (TPR) repeat protein